MVDRAAFLSGLIGKPWRANARGPDAFDCYALVVFVQGVLKARALPDIDVPQHPGWSWIKTQFETHPERARWRIVAPDAMGLMRAPDGATALMARATDILHAGVWLTPENRILHADERQGVSFEDLATLRAKSWKKIVLLVPV